MKKILSRYKFFIGLCTLFTIIGLIGTSSHLVSAEEAKLVDVTITDFRIENLKHEKPASIYYADSFYLAMDWDASAAGVDIHKGDYFDVTLPSNMWFPSDTCERNFELKNQEGVVIGQATVNPGLKDIGGSIHVIFTDAVENRYNVKGTMYLTSKFDKTQTQIGQNNSFSITVNGQVITTEVKITGPNLVGDEILAKWGWGETAHPEKAGWSVRINASGRNLHEVVISDTLGDSGMTYLKDSFKLQRVKYNEYGQFSERLETISGETLINEEKLKIAEDGKSFILTLGDIADGYYLDYSSTYIPGTTLTNKIILTSKEDSKIITANYIGAESGGTGSGDLASKIKITKEDADDNVTPLANAVFEVTAPDGNTFNLTTGADGTVTSGVLKQGTYTVKEVTAPTGYELNEDTFTLEVTPTGGALLTVKDTPIKRSIKVDKKWIGKEGGPVEVILKADGTEVQRASLDVAGNWTHTFDNLREYNANGQKINYTVEEVSLPNYDSAVSGDMDQGFIITNTNNEKVSISGTKTWNDNNNQDGVRPDKITINLLANDEKVDSKEVTANDNWAYSFDNLAKYDDKGKEITYTVTENPVDDYTSEQKGNDFTNTHTPATTEISGTKTWKDNNNQDGIRPDKITIHLMANGQEVHTTEATVANNWSYSFSDLPKFENGQEINYTVIEDQVPGYTGEQNGNDFTNTHTPATIQVSGIKTWNDNNDQDGIRPEKITVNLLANGKKVDSKEVTANDNWSYSFSDLPKFENGQEIKYTVNEDAVKDYTTEIIGNNITNSYTPGKTAVNVTKVWLDNNNQDGIRPSEIKVQLYANGKAIKDKVTTLSAANNWQANFTDLDIKADGKVIDYTVKEVTVPKGYKDKVTADKSNNVTITNSYTPATTEISGTKTWKDNNNQDGIRPDKITIHLMANGQEVHTTEATVANNWSYSFSDLPKFENGQEINYTVIEDQVPGYTGEQNGNDFTNTHTPATIQVSGIKTWNDNNDQDGIRPEKITVNLLANGKKVDSKEVTANDNWSYSFSDLPKFENGQEIKYTVNEDAVKDYTTEIIGNNITNSYTPGKTAVNVTKVWLDNNNQDGIRPSEIKVQLYANGKAIKDKVTTLSAANNWQANFTDLDIKADGKIIDYTVKEVTVPKGYKDKVTADKSNNVTITNSYTPATTQVSGTKTWKDNNNQDGIRPDSITVELLANGESTGNTQTVSVDTNWEYIFKDVPKYANGQEVIYTVREVSIPEGYTSEANGMDITNMHTPETTEVSGTKMWNDNENSVGLRPDSITVNLLANGIKVASQEVTAQSDWNYTFTDLPKYANGNEITYTVTEDTVANYTPTYNGYNITNDYTPGETSVTVTKVWDDNNDQDGIRPDAIQVQLYANGAKLGDVITLTAADNWTYTWTKLDENLTYTVKEVSDIEGYTATVGEVENGNVTITNTHTPTTPGQSDNKSDKKQDKNIIAALLPSTGDSDGFVLSIIGITIIVVIIAVFVYSKVKKHN
ncbi:Cna B-type domain-containing protein [Streptococcus equinus]|uniref:Cna B-type domain-containing protein n=1 Tax=Streptococcus equinus TaxID=1335 RepID=UPI000DFC1D7E|nr:Cna B-type domain-containing protein [Streptococcus equinus]SUO81043.1 cell wall surface anchor family protein [Streptococcus equinus]